MTDFIDQNPDINDELKNQLNTLKNQLDNLRSSTTDLEFKRELGKLSSEITEIKSQKDFDRYLERLETLKHTEILELPLIRTLKNQLSNLQMQVQSSIPSKPDLHNPDNYKATADLGRKVSSQNVVNITSEAAKSSGLLGKAIARLDKRSSPG